MQPSQYLGSARLSASSHSSKTSNRNSLLNGLIPSHRSSQTLTNSSSLTPNYSPNQLRVLNNCNNQVKRSEQIKFILLIICLTIIFALLFITTIELSIILVKTKNEEDISLSIDIISNLTKIYNKTKLEKDEKISPIKSFFACVWFFNLLLFIICLFVHAFIYNRRSQNNRARAVFFR
jgi:hypothetical protein